MIRNKGMNVLWSITVMIALGSCGTSDQRQEQIRQDTTANNAKEELPKAAAPEPKVEPVTLKYTAWPVKKVDTAIKAFKAKYTGADRWAILALNRLDEGNIGRADTLIIPERILPDFNQYSPFPASMPLLKEVNKIAI